MPDAAAPPPRATPHPAAAAPPDPRRFALTGEGWALLLLMALLWGASFLFIKEAVQPDGPFPPLTLVALRVGIASLALLALLPLLRLSLPRDRETWWRFLKLALVGNVVPFILIVWGETRIGAGLASVLNASAPLFTVLLAPLLARDETITPVRVLGVLVGMAGVVAVIWPESGAGPEGGFGLDATWGALAVVLACLAYAISGLYGRRFSGQPPLVTATGQLLAAAAVTLPLALFGDLVLPALAGGASGPAPTIHPEHWGHVAGLALLSTALAYIAWYRLLKLAGAVNASLVTFLIPITGLALGYLVNGEILTLRQAAGVAVIALGLAVLDGRVWRWLRGAATPRPRA